MAHMKWLKNLDIEGLDKETLSEYLITYEYLTEKIERLDQRIEELASGGRYKEKVKNMSCFLGIKKAPIFTISAFKRLFGYSIVFMHLAQAHSLGQGSLSVQFVHG